MEHQLGRTERTALIVLVVAVAVEVLPTLNAEEDLSDPKIQRPPTFAYLGGRLLHYLYG